jgi:hypothetical protein
VALMTFRPTLFVLGAAVVVSARVLLVNEADGTGLADGTLDDLRPATRDRLLEEATRAAAEPPHPVAALKSAGVTDPQDPALLDTRAGFRDADDAAILALAWKLRGDPAFLDAAKGRVLAWSRTNRPTGHPIDTTRLEGLVRAYTIVEGELTRRERSLARSWMTETRDRLRGWELGPKTSRNNHRTHQLKMLVLLDDALDDAAALKADRRAAVDHAAVNIDAASGETVDLVERDALYYHVYDLEPWLEIALTTGCCDDAVRAAYRYLDIRLRTGNLGGEFERSEAPIDGERASAGFGYAARGGSFDPERAERSILLYATLDPEAPDPIADGRIDPDVEDRNLFHLTRYELWTGR